MLTWHRSIRLLIGILGILSVVFIILSTISVVHEPQTPIQYISVLSEKFHIYPRKEPRPDIVFVGSSRVYRGAWPEYIVNQIAENTSVDISVYNFGVGGMSAPMLSKTLDFLVNKADSAQLLFFEPQMVFGGAFEKTTSARSKFSNQFSTIQLGILQILTHSKDDNWTKLRMMSDYLGSFARTGLGTSTFRDLLLQENTVQDSLDLNSYFIQHDGVYPLDIEMHRSKGNRKNNLERRRKQASGTKGEIKVTRKRKRIESLYQKDPRPITIFEQRYIELLINRAKSENTRCGILFMPMLNPNYVERQIAISQYVKKYHPDVPVLETRPSQMPGLYKASLWFDTGHLNSQGARMYSQELGRQISSIITEGEPH